MVKKAKAYGMEALALTDDGNMYATIEFYKECEKAGIKPIIGVDFYLAPRTRHDKESRIDSKRIRLVLLAKNEEGYKNLIQLVTLSHFEGFYYKPRIDKELLEKYCEGLVCIAPSFSSNIVQALKMSDTAKAVEHINFYKKIFPGSVGAPDFYIEITHHPDIEGHEEHMRDLKALAKENNVPIVAANDVYYLDPSDKRACTTLRAVQKSFGAIGDDDDGDFSFITPDQADELFKNEPEAIENAHKIAMEICNCKLDLGKWKFPIVEITSGLSPDDELKRIVYEGFARRKVEKSQNVIDRVEYELSVIKTKGYAAYFLVVEDLLRYAHLHGILTNIRGSVSGSMVTYLSGITNIDPIEFEIPFERFLNPDRPSAPDIDMDFADDRRDEMVEYTRNKYGQDKVAQIGTFGTMAARGSVRDITRALKYPIDLGDKIAKMIPMGSQGFAMTLERALDENAELKEFYDKDEDVKKIIDMAMKIEGSARHVGVHAAGVVISPIPLTDVVPLQFDPKGEGKIITQYDMYSVDEDNAGLLKFDFLGLKNLSIIADTIKRIKKIKNVIVDYENIPIDDKLTFEKLAKGETADLFQLNGDGMTKFLVDLKPTSIHDINAMVALYRPGPIQFIPEFIQRKHGQVPITYLDPMLESILQKTYGILVYQDDLLMMAHKLAGYSWGEVDKFRKAVGKKIPAEMEAQKEKFIKGCSNYSGWSEAKAKELWTWIEPFAAYGFNKAHSVSYGRIAYITAYLKANYPGEYMSSVMTHDSGDIEKVAASVQECKRLRLPVLPPDVNESYREFTLVSGTEKETIRFGLGSIKNFGEGVADIIIEERKTKGRFANLEDFLTRVHNRALNKKSLEALIKTGAFDSFGHDRNTLLSNLDNLLAFNKESSDQGNNQDSLFGGSEIDISGLRLDPVPASTMDERLLWEKELLGLYITGHPLEKHRQKLENRGSTIAIIKESLPEGKECVVAGIVETAKELLTKKGDKMCFVKIADFVSSIEVVVFPKTYKEFEELLKPDTCVMIKGKMSKRNDVSSIIADKVKVL
jgi:DNA polymerase-3 subunit alpha